jgi:hypothetical protein
MSKQELILSGKASFYLEVPYRLYRTGKEGKQPLYVYLHETGRNLAILEKKIAPMRVLPGYHLLIQAPYPDVLPDDDDRTFFWIPNHKDEQTITAAREYVSEFLQEVIDGLLPHIDAGRLVLVGWEGSRNQISYFCATRPHYINEMILFGGSVNRSWMEQDSSRYKHLRMLGLSGKDAEITDETARTIQRWIKGDTGEGHPG